MSLATTVHIPRNEAAPMLQLYMEHTSGAKRRNVLKVIGQAGANEVRENFRILDRDRANRLGGRRSHFYARAARATHTRTGPDYALVSINHLGIRQRLMGGLIKPRRAKLLTIPAHPRAYGRRASEFANLTYRPTSSGAGMLVEAEHTKLRRTKSGLKQGKSGGGEVMFWLARSVLQKPDPTVLPSTSKLTETARNTAVDYITRIINSTKQRKP